MQPLLHRRSKSGNESFNALMWLVSLQPQPHPETIEELFITPHLTMVGNNRDHFGGSRVTGALVKEQNEDCYMFLLYVSQYQIIFCLLAFLK